MQVQATLLTNQRQIRGPHNPTTGSINLQEQLTDHREMLLVFTRVSKDTDEHTDNPSGNAKGFFRQQGYGVGLNRTADAKTG